MPAQDGTGPYGDGRPGRGLGPCGKKPSAAYPIRAGRRGARGRRWR